MRRPPSIRFIERCQAHRRRRREDSPLVRDQIESRGTRLDDRKLIVWPACRHIACCRCSTVCWSVSRPINVHYSFGPRKMATPFRTRSAELLSPMLLISLGRLRVYIACDSGRSVSRSAVDCYSRDRLHRTHVNACRVSLFCSAMSFRNRPIVSLAALIA